MDIPEFSRLKSLLNQHEQHYQLALQEVDEMQNYVRGLQKKGATINEDNEILNQKLKDEVSELKVKVQTYAKKTEDLEDDLHVMGEIAGATRCALNYTQEDLFAVSEELAQLYHHVCMVNDETPNCVMLDHVKGSHIKGFTESNNVADLSEDEKQKPPQINNQLDCLKKKLKSDISVKILLQEENKMDNRIDSSSTCNKLLDTIRDQLTHLKKAVENTIKINHQKTFHSGSQEPSSLAKVEDYQEQAFKLNSLLSTKIDQIATLRTVLKANKQTAEVALANLKSTYENEKSIVSETMMGLRNELKSLKEGAANFSSLRAKFAARNEEHLKQLDELHMQLAAAEEEKKKLNSLLRLAIQQKLSAI